VILLRGEGCNTPGVDHQLSNGFELKHDRLVEMTMPSQTYGDEPNLKCLFKDICLGGVMAISSCVSHHILSILIPGKVS
jgi:hypothetical protein